MIPRFALKSSATGVAAVFAVGIVIGVAYAQSSDEGNTARLERVLAKARHGEPVTVAVIGGSITSGGRASSKEKSYGSLVKDWWQKAFPKSTITFVNAGIGATGTNYGALRAQRDLLSRHPDFVVVEFAANDQNIRADAETLEGLVRQILTQPNQPAAIMLFMSDQTGKNAQEWHGKVGRHYHLPMVSYRDAIFADMKAGRVKWSDYVADEVHPNDRGHAYTAGLVTAFLEKVLKQLPPDDQLPAVEKLPAPLLSDLYEHAALFTADKLTPVKNEGWTPDVVQGKKSWKASKPGSRIEFDVEGQAILWMHWIIRGPMGKVKVQVDDRPAVVRDGWFDQTWGGYCNTEELARDLPPGKHRVAIELLPDKSPKSTGHDFHILGLGAAGVTK